jgi:predicted nucleic acid-binding protein
VAGLIVLDTTVLVDHVRGSEAARAYLLGLRDLPACSEVTRAELLRGIRSGERRATERLMGTIRWIVVDQRISRRAGEFGRRYRRGHAGISVADLIIAATADLVDGDLATSNVRDFPMFKGLRSPY